MTYEEYIASPAWRSLRRTALDRDGQRCRLCDAGDDLEVHHRRYPPGRQWLLDSLDALTTLCRLCHDRVTCDLRGRRYADDGKDSFCEFTQGLRWLRVRAVGAAVAGRAAARAAC